MTAYRAMPFSAAFVSLLVLGCQSGDQPSEDGAAAEAAAARGEASMTSPPPILATNVFYYYDDVEAAWAFYTETLGLRTVVDYGFAKILRRNTLMLTRCRDLKTQSALSLSSGAHLQARNMTRCPCFLASLA